jgi:hypothetical protein
MPVKAGITTKALPYASEIWPVIAHAARSVANPLLTHRNRDVRWSRRSRRRIPLNGFRDRGPDAAMPILGVKIILRTPSGRSEPPYAFGSRGRISATPHDTNGELRIRAAPRPRRPVCRRRARSDD